jgi:hypothetical protein
VLVAHTYNPSYWEGRDQEVQSLGQIVVVRPYLKKTHHIKGLVEWLKI